MFDCAPHTVWRGSYAQSTQRQEPVCKTKPIRLNSAKGRIYEFIRKSGKWVRANELPGDEIMAAMNVISSCLHKMVKDGILQHKKEGQNTFYKVADSKD